ncbi:hypothetical protein E1B28_003644 [Marasmius oreades]|uniref:Uncharacterized protein n=1 Tax=Marasmius oreades TaxID=181124 RepID=A0A9P8AB00_9AGAR|nr:uncharacterized protein E1B28_003644 [Marasmius oreades]KAG7096194.1 hypothetical protein E1B28_003644 [Marasmius oreades]
MSHLEYFSYPGFGETTRQQFWFNQAVRIGDRIEISGQGGWDPTTGSLQEGISYPDEIDSAFSNVDLALKHAGGKGWPQVYSVKIYMADLSKEGLAVITRYLKMWMPDHQPLLTVVGVAKLALPGMRIEVEVCAHVSG